MSRVLLALAMLAGAHDASASVTRCSSAETDLAYHSEAFAELGGDTGWFPSWSPAQIRITARVAGQTSVAIGLRPTVCWDERGMHVKLPARAAAGELEVGYGAELHLFAHIDTTILGNPILWERELPIPFIPEDLILAGGAKFEPELGVAASVYDATQPVPVLFTDLIGALISITGISGGLHIDVVGSMVASYTTTRLTSGGDAVTEPGAAIEVDAPKAGFGAALVLPVAAEGVITYRPSLTFNVGVDLRILGIRVADYTLFGIPMDLATIERQVTLSGDGARIPLPALGELGPGARVDFASGATQELAVRNRGEAVLMLELASAPGGVTATPLTIMPGAEAILRVTASPEALAAGLPTSLVLATNDPDHGSLSIALGIDVGGTDGGGEDDSGGCNASGGSHGLLMLSLALLALRRRRGVLEPQVPAYLSCSLTNVPSAR